jgi:hypothetical protein
LSDVEWVKVVSGSDSNDKSVDAPCPRGKATIAGGARISGPGEPYVHLTALAPMDELGYTATAEEYFGHTALPWQLTTWAVCAKDRDTYARAAESVAGYPFAWSLTAHSICTDDARFVAQSSSPSTLQNPKAWSSPCDGLWPANSVGFHLVGPAGAIGVNDVLVGPTTYAVTAYLFPPTQAQPWAIEAHTVCVQPTFG